MRHAPRIEARRVLAARPRGSPWRSPRVYCALFTYAAGELEIKADFSYFRTARPSESTANIVESLSEPLK